MAKKDKVTKEIPEGMKCFQKIGGGSLRFPNRIIKTGQRFWIYPESIPDAFKIRVKEVPADYGAVIVTTATRPRIEGKKVQKDVPEKFKMIKAVGEDGKTLKKGNSSLYNVIGEDKTPLNEKPLRKNKAEELLEALNA